MTQLQKGHTGQEMVTCCKEMTAKCWTNSLNETIFTQQMKVGVLEGKKAHSVCVCRYKGASGSSAVCAFTMAQVERAFSGRYREVNRETQQWYTYNHPVPEPRPGAVSAAGSVLLQTIQFNLFWSSLCICSFSSIWQKNASSHKRQTS